MKYVLAIDSFKGCLTSEEAEKAAEKGIIAVDKEADIVKVPVSDGGEGMLDVLATLLPMEKKRVSSYDESSSGAPLRRNPACLLPSGPSPARAFCPVREGLFGRIGRPAWV